VKRWIWPLAVWTLLTAASASQAQELSAHLQKQLQQYQGKPFESWTEKDFEGFEGLMVAMSREILLSGLPPTERARLQEVQVKIAPGGSGPPAWTEGEAIYLSSDALGDAVGLGLYLGHDLYIQGGYEFRLAQPLLTRPFQISAILPLLPSLADILLSGFPLDLVKCPDSNDIECAEPQGAAVFAGTLGFLVAHEMGHILLDHERKKDRLLAEELAADRRALALLQRVAPDSGDSEDLESRIRAAIEAGPFLVLRWQLDRQSDDAQREASESRLDALWNLVTPNLSVDISSVVEPKPVIGRLRSIKVVWAEKPDELYVEGVKLDPAEVENMTLQAFGPVRIFARREDRFAFEELSAVARSQPQVATLAFHPLSPLPEERLKQLRRERKWFELFLATASPSFTPRPGVSARYFYEVLDRMRIGRFIDPEAASLDRRTDRALAIRLRSRAEPLGAWRPDPGRQ
jgi:hypothetical protein